MNYESAVSAYLTSCAASGKSKDTLASYTRTLSFFASFLSSRSVCSLADVTPALLVEWKNETAARLSPSSLRLYATHLKCFFDFCADIEYIARTPFKKKLMEVSVKEEALKDTTAHVLSESDFQQILRNDKPQSMHRRSMERNRAILAILLTSGIRCESLCRLTLSDFCDETHTLRIRNAKGGKNGEILLSSVAIIAVRKYLHSGYIPYEGWNSSEPLFGFVDASGAWTPFCREQMSAIVESAVRGFTGKSGFYAHSMRHTFASLLSSAGLADGEISVLLMHSDGTGARVTSRYIDRNNTSLFLKANEVFSRLSLA